MFAWRQRCSSFGQQAAGSALRRHHWVRPCHANKNSNTSSAASALLTVSRACCSLSDGRGSSSDDVFAADGSRSDEPSTSPLAFCDAPSPRRAQLHDDSKSATELLCAAGLVLRDAAEAEIRAEIERDSRDGVAAIPPLPPLGWKVQHPVGSNFFVMTCTLRGGTRSAELNTRRYQSVHDMFLQSVGEDRRRQQQKRAGGHTRGGAASGSAQSSDASSSRMVVGYEAGARRRPVLHAMETTRDQPSVERADVQLRVFAPFRVYDPSSHDSSVNICEWSAFDVLVRKSAVGSTNSNERRGPTNPLESLPHLVEEDGLCMFLRLASVNSEMRVRSVQLLSRREAQALEEHACFGRGEPTFLELMRCRRHERASTRRLRSVRRYDDPLTLVHKIQHPKASPTFSSSSMSTATGNGMCDSAYEFLVDCFDTSGEYSRALCFGGPCVSELSKEMLEALQDYLQGDLGLSAEFCEYVCQMQFFLEQEEYMAWLGRLRHMAAAVSGEGTGGTK
ncbi:hypothetical protein DQ04_10651030 [Trypanosoma grayi]|uniref:hypothetical protein n=1 Tax=Trypanosoma grayi TaxID=71804 RepID=UPI0004F4A72C|nr:hypothetical protein DQ04_10651030 [Trypanosoma grayi]KEG07177.1 hypothetical protein DQ04_10651030 [Trypanosoma grayi]